MASHHQIRMFALSCVLFTMFACTLCAPPSDTPSRHAAAEEDTVATTSLNLSGRPRGNRSLFFGHLPYFESSEGAKGPSPAMADGRLKFVPLKDFVDRAKGDPVLLYIIRKALQRVGFDGEEVLQLLSRGKSTFKGNYVTIDDVSKFCCPLGV